MIFLPWHDFYFEQKTCRHAALKKKADFWLFDILTQGSLPNTFFSEYLSRQNMNTEYYLPSFLKMEGTSYLMIVVSE